MLDLFDVIAKDLMPKSSVDVVCVCDYCGESYTTHYAVYRKSVERGKLSCAKCKDKKIEDSFMDKYGVKAVGASKEFHEIAKESMVNRYGHEYMWQTEIGQKKFKETMLRKYGVDNPSRHPEIHARSVKKMLQTQYKNGNSLTSKPEKHIVNMLQECYGADNCLPSYVVGRAVLDCLLIIDNVKIDVEYDGKYWHNGREDHDRKRNHWLIYNGYKVLRIEGNDNDDLPTIKRICEAVDLLLSGKDLVYINMNKEQLR